MSRNSTFVYVRVNAADAKEASVEIISSLSQMMNEHKNTDEHQRLTKCKCDLEINKLKMLIQY